MLFTEANLENIKITQKGKFYSHERRKSYIYHYACQECGYPHLNVNKDAKYCSNKCAKKDRNNCLYYGKKRPSIIGEKVSKSKMGKKRAAFTDEARKNMGIAHQKHRHWNWQGGISCEPYCEVWTDKEYKDWLKYERDGGKCQNPGCNGTAKRICLHHINYDKKDCRPVNLITLCNSCNVRANKNRDWHEIHYTEIIKLLLGQ